MHGSWVRQKSEEEEEYESPPLEPLQLRAARG